MVEGNTFQRIKMKVVRKVIVTLKKWFYKKLKNL